jgi:N-acetylneuraminic acid mutarotase
MTPTVALFGALLQAALVWTEAPPLPLPIANNAVAAVQTADGPAVFSFLGIDSTRAWNGRSSAALQWDIGAPTWRTLRSVPGEGRLAATAQSIHGKVYLFGGYTVAEDGSERSLPNVDIYDPDADEWSSGAPIPTPVDDAVSGVWRDSLIYLVSGWHDRDNVADVQIYDPATDRWQAGTPIPGTPVFGHAGGIAGNTIVYLGGARTSSGRPRYRIEASAWAGEIDPSDPTRIVWRRLPAHPGPALYRAAAVGVDGHRVLFAGGTDNPYNYNGLGYDGVAAEPRDGVFAYDVEAERWVALADLSVATMDHRGIVVLGPELFIVGGMEAGQRVSSHVARARLGSLLSSEADPQER